MRWPDLFWRVNNVLIFARLTQRWWGRGLMFVGVWKLSESTNPRIYHLSACIFCLWAESWWQVWGFASLWQMTLEKLCLHCLCGDLPGAGWVTGSHAPGFAVCIFMTPFSTCGRSIKQDTFPLIVSRQGHGLGSQGMIGKNMFVYCYWYKNSYSVQENLVNSEMLKDVYRSIIRALQYFSGNELWSPRTNPA